MQSIRGYAGSGAYARQHDPDGDPVSDPQFYDSGYVTADEVIGGCVSQVSTGGTGWSATAHAVGSVKTWFNPDNQAVLQWAFLHNLAADGSYNDNGTTIEVNSFASAESNVKVDASLVHNPPGPGNTTGFLRVDCGWVGNWTDNVTHAIMRDIRMHIRFGLAYIDLFRDQNNFPYCMVGVGVDGYGQPFAKAGSYMMGAGTGSFGIGINEFASPLNESSGASIRRFPPPDDTPAYATSCVGGGVYGSFYDQQTWAEGDIFQGTFEIWANQP